MPSPSAESPSASTFAIPAPWRLQRGLPPPWYRLEHHGSEPARAVSVSLLGSARLLALVPGSVRPGQWIRFAAIGADPADDSILIVRWLRPDGDEYLWRSVF